MGNEERRSAVVMASRNTDMKGSILKRLTAHNHELTDSPEQWVTLLKTCQEIVASQRRLDHKAIALEEYSQTLSDWYQDQLTLAYYEKLSWPMSKAIFLLCIDIEALPESHQFYALFRAEKRPSAAIERYLSIRPCNNRYLRHTFDKWLMLLDEYHVEHGSMHVPEAYRCKAGQRLGEWVKKTQKMYINMELSISEIQRLKSSGFPLDPGQSETPSESDLLAHDQSHDEDPVSPGDANETHGINITKNKKQNKLLYNKFSLNIAICKESLVDPNIDDLCGNLLKYSDERLHDWYLRQRLLALNGELSVEDSLEIFKIWISISSTHIKEKITKTLDTKDFASSLRLLRGIAEESNYEALKIAKHRPNFDTFLKALIYYKKNNDSLFVPEEYVTESGLYLGRWLKETKSKASLGRLDSKEVRKLREVGFVINIPLAPKNSVVALSTDSVAADAIISEFDLFLNDLILFKEKNGNLNVPRWQLTKDGRPLGKWWAYTKNQIVKGELSEEELGKLKSKGLDQFNDDKSRPKDNIPNSISPKIAIDNSSGREIDANPNKNTPSHQGENNKKQPSAQRDLSLLLDDIAKCKEGFIGSLKNAKNKSVSDLHEFLKAGFDEILLHLQAGGQLSVPKVYKTSSGFPIGLWLLAIKVRHQKGLIKGLPPEIISRN